MYKYCWKSEIARGVTYRGSKTIILMGEKALFTRWLCQCQEGLVHVILHVIINSMYLEEIVIIAN